MFLANYKDARMALGWSYALDQKKGVYAVKLSYFFNLRPHNETVPKKQALKISENQAQSDFKTGVIYISLRIW